MGRSVESRVEQQRSTAGNKKRSRSRESEQQKRERLSRAKEYKRIKRMKPDAGVVQQEIDATKRRLTLQRSATERNRTNQLAEQSSRSHDSDEAAFFAEIDAPLTRVCAVCGGRVPPKSTRKILIDTNDYKFKILAGAVEQELPNRGLLAEGITREKGGEHAHMCVRCYTSLSRRQIPRYSLASGFRLGDVPKCLAQLNPMEARMIGLGLCFTTCYSLGHLGQSATRGNSINIWNDSFDIVKTLPRPADQCGVILVKLPGSHRPPSYYHVRPWLLLEALRWLKANNSLYEHVEIDEELLAQMPEIPDLPDVEMDAEDEEFSHGVQTAVDHGDGELDDVEESFVLREVDDHRLEDEKILEVLTGSDIERAYPLPSSERLMNEYTTEHLMQCCFPTLFPTGRGGFHCLNGEDRTHSFKLAEYCEHLMSWHDWRFVAHPTFKFFCLNLIQRRQIDGLLTRLRSGRSEGVDCSEPEPTAPLSTATTPTAAGGPAKTRAKQYLAELKPYFRSVRGTGLYWANVRGDLMSLLGNPALDNPWPTFFITLSAADTVWPDFFRVCDPSLSLEEAAVLPPAERRRHLNENPDLAAHHFQRRFLAFFNHILRGKEKPLGEIEDYFWRIEFQRRGSPHVHALIWVKGSPDILELCKTEEGRETLRDYADRFVSCLARFENGTHRSDVNVDPLCTRPPPVTCTEAWNRDLGNVVKRVQQHVCSARSSCQRDGQCRFGFPKPLQSSTDVVCEEKSGKISVQFVHARDNDATNNYNATMLSIWRANMDIKIVGNAYGAAEYTAAYVSKAEPDSVRFHRTIDRALAKVPCGASHSAYLRRTATALLAAREVSAQEAIYILSNTLCLYGKSRTIVKIKVTRHRDRYYRLDRNDPADVKRTHDPNSIRIEPLERAYMHRPRLPAFELLTYREFCESYEVTDMEPAATQRLPRWCLDNTSGFIKARARKQAVRPSPYTKADESDPNFCFAQLIMYRPWRSVDELPYEDEDVLDEFKVWKEECRSRWTTCVEERVEREIALATQTRTVQLPAPQWCIRLPHDMDGHVINAAPVSGAFQSRFNYTQNDVLRAKAFLKNVVRPFVAQSQLERPSNSDWHYIYPTFDRHPAMTDDQWKPFAIWMVQSRRRALALRDKQKCPPVRMVVAGEGGTGKSWLIRHILRDVEIAFASAPKVKRVLLMAHQGSAAHLIGGRTLTSALGLPGQGSSFRRPYVSLADTDGGPATLRRLQNEYENVHLVVIDEFGVISCGMLLWIEARLREIFAHCGDLPFGGRDILFTGDTGQLGPVSPSPLSTPLAMLHLRAEVEGRNLWTELPLFFVLKQQNRGHADPSWYEMLGRVRNGEPTKADLALINSRVMKPTASQNQVYVAYRNCDVHEANETALRCLNHQVQQIVAHHDVKVRTPADAVGLDAESICQLQEGAKTLTCPAANCLPLTLNVAVGAPVILSFNIEQRAGLCNGSRGVVYDVIPDSESSAKLPILLVQFDTYRGPSFVDGVAGIVPITAKTVSLAVDKQCKYRFTRTALPIQLGYATTIHKIQGQTCERVVFNPSRLSTSALAYVALSRVRSRTDIVLTSAVTEKQLQKTERQRRIDTSEDERLEPVIVHSIQYANKLVGAMQLIASSHNAHDCNH